jgi:hypothetical protein
MMNEELGFGRILVFPATHPLGLAYTRARLAEGIPTVAASSVLDADAAEALGELLLLPFVHEEEFVEAFLGLLKTRHVTRVYAPVAAVHAWLRRFIAERGLALELLGDSPIGAEMARFRDLRFKASRSLPFVFGCTGSDAAVTPLELSAVLQMSANIYGESNDHKIAALLAIATDTLCGDVVEIGALAGKSAAVLAWLARRFSIGQVLAIDPWRASEAIQVESPATVRADMVGEWDYEMLKEDFVCNVLPVGYGQMNYLRAPSAAAHAVYAEKLSVHSPEFGYSKYCGRIALLHIDGNHDYAHAREDCELWLPHLCSGSWLVLDDYLWVHGNGPQLVGNELLVRNASIVECAFVCGKALFVKFSGCPIL